MAKDIGIDLGTANVFNLRCRKGYCIKRTVSCRYRHADWKSSCGRLRSLSNGWQDAK